MIQIGFNARLFPNNWRPIHDEIVFAAANGFTAIQVIGRQEEITSTLLGADISAVREDIQAARLNPVMEINMSLGLDGRTDDGSVPMDLLRVNLPAILTLGITAVHWHCTLLDRKVTDGEMHALESSLTPQLQQAVDLAAQHGFRFGLEHNAPDLRLFAHPDDMAAMLDRVPGLGFVWDFNHTHPDHAAGFKALSPRLSLLHVSDAPLPETNYHLPLGLGTINVADYCQTALEAGYTGVAVLEIGGLPKSGGYGRDTDEALQASRTVLAAACRQS